MTNDTMKGPGAVTNAEWLQIYEDSGEMPPASVLKQQMAQADQQIADLTRERDDLAAEVGELSVQGVTLMRERDEWQNAAAVEAAEANAARGERDAARELVESLRRSERTGQCECCYFIGRFCDEKCRCATRESTDTVEGGE